MLEYWNVGILGMKSGKRHILKMLGLHLLMMFTRQLFSTFDSKILDKDNKINVIIFSLISLFFKPIIPLFQHSIIPIAELSSLLRTYFRPECRVTFDTIGSL